MSRTIKKILHWLCAFLPALMLVMPLHAYAAPNKKPAKATAVKKAAPKTSTKKASAKKADAKKKNTKKKDSKKKDNKKDTKKKDSKKKNNKKDTKKKDTKKKDNKKDTKKKDTKKKDNKKKTNSKDSKKKDNKKDTKKKETKKDSPNNKKDSKKKDTPTAKKKTPPVIPAAPETAVRKQEKVEETPLEPIGVTTPKKTIVNKPIVKQSHSKQEADDLLMHAMSLLGLSYRFGGTSTSSGLDCSAFMQYVFRKAWGVNLPRTSAAQFETGTPVQRENLRPGDLVFFSRNKKRIGHVGMYIGNNQFIHAPSTGKNIEIQRLDKPYYVKNYMGARRYSRSNIGVQ